MPDAAQESGSTAALAEGRIIGGKYRLVSELGVGAMGTVWSATHQTLGHQVAIKFLLRSIMASEEARHRFDREARVAARLSEASRHITRVIDHGVTDDRIPFLVMELLRGEPLSAKVKRERRIPLQLTALVVQQLSRALHVAHSAGIIHRDLKPANIFLCTPEQGDEVDVKLLDFGIAKATSETDAETTGEGQVLGTPSYMSPEQLLGNAPIDVRADLWSVAAVVYRMVVGRSPFGSGPIPEIGMRVVSIEPVPPSQVWTDLPRQLDMWMQRGLAKKPEERFQTARELSDFLSVVAGTTATQSTPGAADEVQRRILHGDESSQSLQTTTGSHVQSQAPPSMAARRRWVAPVVAAAVLLVGLAVFAATRGGGDREAAAAVASASKPPEPQLAPSPSVLPPTVPASASSSTQKASGAPPKGKPKRVDGSGWGNKKEL